MKQKLFTLLAFMVISVAVFGQARPGSRFFQTTMVRMCDDISGEVATGCKDFPNSTIWQITNDLVYVKMINDGTSTMYISSTDHEENSPKFYFLCRDVQTNMLYDFLLDFESKTIFLLDRSDNKRFLFYWNEQWENENAY